MNFPYLYVVRLSGPRIGRRICPHNRRDVQGSPDHQIARYQDPCRAASIQPSDDVPLGSLCLRAKPGSANLQLEPDVTLSAVLTKLSDLHGTLVENVWNII